MPWLSPHPSPKPSPDTSPDPNPDPSPKPDQVKEQLSELYMDTLDTGSGLDATVMPVDLYNDPSPDPHTLILIHTPTLAR